MCTIRIDHNYTLMVQSSYILCDQSCELPQFNKHAFSLRFRVLDFFIDTHAIS